MQRHCIDPYDAHMDHHTRLDSLESKQSSEAKHPTHTLDTTSQLTRADMLMERTLNSVLSKTLMEFSATDVFPVPTGPTSIMGLRLLMRVVMRNW